MEIIYKLNTQSKYRYLCKTHSAYDLLQQRILISQASTKAIHLMREGLQDY